MSFENFISSSSENVGSENKEKNEEQKDNFNSIKESIEHKTGKKLPENKEDLFRNFDELIPTEIDSIDFKSHGYVGAKKNPDGSFDLSHAAGFTYPEKISRKEMKSRLEKDLYGATMEEINDYFVKELHFAEKELSREQRSMEIGYIKTYDNRLLKKHDKVQESVNCLSTGIIEFPLAYIELKINDISISESEKDKLRKFAERLSAERYKNMKNKLEHNVSIDDVKKQIKENIVYFSDFKINEDVRKDNIEHLNKVLESLDNGDVSLASEEIEFSIAWIQERLEEIKNKDLKDISKELLKERYGEDFMFAVNKKLEKLRSLRKFLNSRMD